MGRGETTGLQAEADRLIRGLYTGQVGWSARERAQDLKLRAAFAGVRGDGAATAALHRLVYGLQRRTRLVGIEPVIPGIGPQAGNTGIDLLMHLARRAPEWLQEPEGWTAGADDARTQAGALLRHLFARYPLPVFLDAAWLGGSGEEAEAQRGWFVHLGRGGKLEAIRFPLPMTHRAAHHFLQAPDDFTVVAAMRFGQIRARGGGALARTVAETFLSEQQPDEAFWLSAIHFLVNHPEIAPAEVEPLLDFVRFRRCGSRGQDAPEPGFTLKGRTVEALRRRVDEWHETLARLGRKGRQTWGLSGIAEMDRIAPDTLSSSTCHWRIVEITDTLTLAEEGRALRHCVRSYQERCVEGATSIWSLRLTLSDSPILRRLLTIEVNNQRRSIVQVRAKCNQPLPSLRGNRRMMQARDVLRFWAHCQHLGIACNL